MLVTVEDQGKLKRKLSIEVPLADVQQTYDQVYSEIRTQVRVNGFRPGKFPRALAEKRFKSLMAQEAVQNLVPRYFDQALKDKELRPATEPKFQNLVIDKKEPLKFDVEFEIFPSFELLAPSDFKLEDKPVVVTDEQLEERITQLRKSRSTFEDRGGPAETGDLVTFDFEGTRDGAPFPGSSGKGQKIEIGAGQYLKDFDAQLAGMGAGQTKAFDLTFPADYADATLAGKTAQFTVTTHKIEKAVPAALNAEFFKQFGEIETEEAFRDRIRKRLQEEGERSRLSAQQQALADQIRAKYAFEVPESSVDRLLHQFEHELERSDPEALKDAAKLAALKEERKTKVSGDLRLDFVIETYARKTDLHVDPQLLRERFMMQAYMMRQNPSDLLKTQYGEQMLEYIRQQMLSGKVLGHLVYTILGKEIPAEFKPGKPQEAPGHEGHDHEAGGHVHDHGEHGHAH